MTNGRAQHSITDVAMRKPSEICIFDDNYPPTKGA